MNNNPIKSILSKQLNFRDLGGTVTIDGRKVKPGLVFRSGDLFSLPDEDIRTLELLQISTIIDLRAKREIVNRPDTLISTVKEIVHIDIHDDARDKAEQFLKDNDAAGLETVLIGDYIRMVDFHQQDFRKFLHILATTENLPLVYHCAAGKDRTGLATIFLLSALGVDMNQIWADYMATNYFASFFTEKIIRKVTASGLNGDILRPLLEVREEYLTAALTVIDRRYAGLQNFVKNVLQADSARLQEKFLTNHSVIQ